MKHKHLFGRNKEKINCNLAIGNFDGCHIGHQKIIREIKALSTKYSIPAVVMLFEPQPQEFLNNQTPPARLMTLQEKELFLQSEGIDRVCALKFDEKIAQMEPEEFFKQEILAKFKVKYLIAGHDFRFGKKRKGDTLFLNTLSQLHDFQFIEISPVKIDEKRISSTLLREVLQRGELEAARDYLARDYNMVGKITYGEQKGSKLGFPTANIDVNRQKSPLTGVFAVTIDGFEKRLFGIANIGIRPTINKTHQILETHIFDFKQDIYGRYVRINFIKKIRDEKKYPSLDLLKKQIAQDVIQVKKFFHTKKIHV